MKRLRHSLVLLIIFSILLMPFVAYAELSAENTEIIEELISKQDRFYFMNLYSLEEVLDAYEAEELLEGVDSDSMLSQLEAELENTDITYRESEKGYGAGWNLLSEVFPYAINLCIEEESNQECYEDDVVVIYGWATKIDVPSNVDDVANYVIDYVKSALEARNIKVASDEYVVTQFGDYIRILIDGEGATDGEEISGYVYINKVDVEEKEEYEFLEGQNQQFDASKNSKLTFRVDVEYNEFVKNGKVYMDDKLVDSKYYTLTEGSTIITFTEEYSNALEDGAHTLKLTVGDIELSTKFTVINTEPTPDTYDNIVVNIAMLLISTVGLVTISLKRKNALNN